MDRGEEVVGDGWRQSMRWVELHEVSGLFIHDFERVDEVYPVRSQVSQD